MRVNGQFRERRSGFGERGGGNRPSSLSVGIRAAGLRIEVVVPVDRVDHRHQMPLSDLEASLRGEDAHSGLVRLECPDRLFHVVMRFEVFDRDDVAILVVAAVKIHRRRLQSLGCTFDCADEAEAAASRRAEEPIYRCRPSGRRL